MATTYDPQLAKLLACSYSSFYRCSYTYIYISTIHVSSMWPLNFLGPGPSLPRAGFDQWCNKASITYQAAISHRMSHKHYNTMWITRAMLRDLKEHHRDKYLWFKRLRCTNGLHHESIIQTVKIHEEENNGYGRWFITHEKNHKEQLCIRPLPTLDCSCYLSVTGEQKDR